jgi:hypothetical protein
MNTRKKKQGKKQNGGVLLHFLLLSIPLFLKNKRMELFLSKIIRIQISLFKNGETQIHVHLSQLLIK